MKANFLPLVLTFNAVILFNVVSAAVYLCCIFGVIGNYIQTASALVILKQQFARGLTSEGKSGGRSEESCRAPPSAEMEG